MKADSHFKENYNKKEVIELLRQPGVRNRNDLGDGESDAFDYYQLPDGRLLLVLRFGNGSGIMYRSEEEFRTIIGAADIRNDGEHVLSNLIPDKDQFLRSENEYLNMLAKRLGLDISIFDRSVRSLKKIDSAYRLKKPLKVEFFEKDYLYLILYLGLVYINSSGGDWIFKKEKHQISYQPLIQTKSGRILNPFTDLFKECYENFEKFSLFQLALAQLLSNGITPK